MRVVFTILDSMPPEVVTSEATPHLWEQVASGGRAPLGALSLPISVTYSNHAAFMTGVGPEVTGLWGNSAWVDGAFIKTPKAGPRSKTLFDRCAASGRSSAVGVGDHKLITTMGAGVADQSWPPTPQVPDGTAVDLLGYPADSAVVAAVSELDLHVDLVVLHLNEPDTTLHIFGPQSEEFREQVGRSDAAYGELVDLLQPEWGDTVMISVSDHRQEQITNLECVNLKAACVDQGWGASVAHDGTGAVVVGDVSLEVVRAVPGVEGAVRGDAQTVLAWTEPGRMFGVGEALAKGNHGSPRCRPQMAIISGGHAAVPTLARQIEVERPSTLTWAPLIQDLLGM